MKGLRLLPLLILLCLLTGCGGHWIYSDYREIDQLELIRALGLDRRDGLITATASTGPIGEEEPMVITCSAATVTRALRQMQDHTSRRYIFFGHTRHLLLGEDAARQGVDLYLEHVERSVEMRLNTLLYVVCGGTAEELISAAGKEGEGVVALLDSLEKDVQLMSESHVFTCGEVAEMLAERGCGLAAAVSLVRQEDVPVGGKPVSVRAEGYAVLKDRRLAGYLDGELARGANLLMEETGEDVLEVPDGMGGWAALRLKGSKASYAPEFRDGELRSLRIRVELRCGLEDVQDPLDLYDGDAVLLLEREAETLELGRVCRVLELSREMEADFCGLGDRVRRKAPWRFSRMTGTWEACFPTLPIEVTVACRLTGTYDAGESLIRKSTEERE